jgi:hypothetical protein
MSAEAVLIALLGLFRFMSGDNRQCVEARRDRIVEQLHETARMGVPAEVSGGGGIS